MTGPKRELTKEGLSDKEKLKKIKSAVKLAGEWCTEQDIPEGHVCMAALKDIRRIIRS